MRWGDYVSNKIIKVEYDKDEFMGFEIKSSLMQDDEALGGISVVQDITMNAYERSIEKMTTFLKSAANKIKKNLRDLENDGITISVGFALNAGGNFIVSSSVEASFVVEVNLKG